MEQSGRNYLTGSIELSRNKDGSFPEKYDVKSIIGEGGFSVCYEANRTLQDGVVETGKLKEFYPIDAVSENMEWYYSLERLSNGQLVLSTGRKQKFDEMCNDYIGTYNLLDKVMEKNPENEILKSYIQQGEILYGCDNIENRPTSVYIWTRGVSGKGFDVYLEEGKKKPSYQPEDRLVNILTVMSELTDCIKALHTAGLVHMDIKPSNFLLQYDSDFKIKSNHISLFDINTLASAEDASSRAAGSEGYCAPEVKRGQVDNRSDIYSLGAMLFEALVIRKDIPDGLYRDFYYPSIGELVQGSTLFLASEMNSDKKLMKYIVQILEKCLAKEPKKRYESCKDLKEDLIKAKNRLTQMLWTPVENDKIGITDPTVIMQKLLYEHPLYQSVPMSETDLNVLVIGAGTYGQKFMDICLQLGQMSGKHLHILAVSKQPEEDKETYLSTRPGLCEFVDVDGSMEKNRESAYATLDFHGISEEGNQNIRFTSKPSQLNREIIEKLIRKSVIANQPYHYVFVALGSDALSQATARICAEELEYSCPVCYVSGRVKRDKKGDLLNQFYSVCVNEPIDEAVINQRLGEMAFNTYISWNSTSMLNMDITRERQQFFKGESDTDNYNRVSSLMYAISIKYKLYSVGIDCDDMLEAAKSFSKQILENREMSDEARESFNQLVDLEHRRWCLEKVVDGWTTPRDEDGNLQLADCIVRGSVKDPVKRTHPCLVHGSQTAPLSTQKYLMGNRKKWDEGEIDPQLDELDRMSIELHRCFKREAKQMKLDNLYQNPDLAFIEHMIPNDCEEVERAFKQFQFALKNIINGVESYSYQFGFYLDSFKSTLCVLSEETSIKIMERLDVVEHAFFPIIESNMYRDYKANDEVLVEKIPFILTFVYRSSIAVALEDGKYQNGRNEAVFANVAAATVLSPERITFLYCYNKDSSMELLEQKLDAIVHYFRKRKVRCTINIVVVCVAGVSKRSRMLLRKRFKSLSEKYTCWNGNAWIESYVVLEGSDYQETAGKFIHYLNKYQVDLYDGGNLLFPSAYDNAMFIRNITESQIAYYEFDWRDKVFSTCIGCEYLRFFRDASFISVHDMFALMNAKDNRFHLPEFAEDYETLWNIYTAKDVAGQLFEHGVSNWNRLCMALSKHEALQNPLTTIYINTNQQPVYQTVVYYLPEHTFATVKRLLEDLIEYKIVETESYLTNHTSDTCKLEIRVDSEYKKQLDEVFYNHQVLLPYYGVEIQKYDTRIEVKCNMLTVVDANLAMGEKDKLRFTIGLLQQLEKANFISQLKQNANNGLVSFSYSSPRMKKLLTSAGEILEIYAYYEALKTGYFDDVACGYEFSWESGGVKNELDLVLTKGFKSIIVECKAVIKLELNHYHKLHSIADQFGIGTTKVLLGNTYAVNSVVADQNNAMQQSRGNQLHIKTISNETEIMNIGKTLVQIMEGTL